MFRNKSNIRNIILCFYPDFNHLLPLLFYYRPMGSCGKVMFSQDVCLSMEEGWVCLVAGPFWKYIQGVGMLEGEGTGIPEDGVVCIPPGHGTLGTDT